MKKRLKAALLAAAMLLSVAAGSLQAMAAGTVTVSQVSGTKDELVDVTISLTSDDVASGNFYVRYDGSALELISAVATTEFNCYANPYEEGVVRVSFVRLTTITDALICTLTFRITEDTSSDGTAVVLDNVMLYNENSQMVGSEVVQGSVARKTVRLSMSASDTAMYQAVSAVVELGGTLSPAGGNFSVTYDPECFEVKSVLALEAMGSAIWQYNIVEPGLVKVSFSNSTELSSGALCSLVFETTGNAGSSTELEITDVRMYGENLGILDVSVVNGSLNIVVPSDDDPKLWVVGGSLEEECARVAVILQGRGYACGGNFTLAYDNAMTATIKLIEDCQVNHDAEAGTIQVSWAAAVPYSGETEMLQIVFTDAVESTVDIQNVKLFFAESEPIPVVDVRPGQITADAVVTAVVDEVVAETDGSTTTYTVAVDVADLNYFTDMSNDSVTPVLALYEDGKMVGLDMQMASSFSSGVNEISLSVESEAAVSGANVFLLSGVDDMVPLATLLEISSAQLEGTN